MLLFSRNIPALLLCIGAAVAAFSPVIAAGGTSFLSTLSHYARQLFTESMDWLDRMYDADAGYVFDPSAAAALRHDTRTSAWYAVGLLARNRGDDVEQAMLIIKNVIDGQFKDPKDQWYCIYSLSFAEFLDSRTTPSISDLHTCYSLPFYTVN